LRLGLVDELNLHIEPALLGGGARLFADVGSDRIRLERTRLIDGPATTHVQFRVLR
jgi:riboflavin biosynthesis pyrimidine reductase